MHRLPTAIVCAALVSFAAPARADGADPDRLFADATALIGEERYADAIPLLEEAQRLDPGIGTQYNLAVCYGKTGKLALAWRNLVQVETLARAAGKKQREEAAHAMLEELRPRVSHAVVRVEERGEVTVRMDGDILAPADFAFVALDPGTHTLEAVAPERKPFTSAITIRGEGEEHAVVVPVLDRLEAKTEIRTVTTETTNTRRTLGWVVGGVGVAGLATAAVTGIMVLSAKSTADDHCHPDCVLPNGDVDTTGADAVHRGKTLLPINLAAFGVGIAGVGVGTFLLLTSSKKDPPKTALIPVVDAHGAYSVLATSF